MLKTQICVTRPQCVNEENRRATPRLVGYPHYKACSRVALEHIWKRWWMEADQSYGPHGNLTSFLRVLIYGTIYVMLLLLMVGPN